MMIGIGIGMTMGVGRSDSAPQEPASPVNTALPVISGTPTVGQTLTANNGTWTGYPLPSYAKQWNRDGDAIEGATGSSYQLVAADYEAVITVTVTATNSEGSDDATSAGTSAVAGTAPANTVAPAISGTATAGETLTCSSGTWAGVPTPSISYQWLRDDSPISGATASTYTLIWADEEAEIGCAVTATNAVGSDAAYAEEVGPVEADWPLPEITHQGMFPQSLDGGIVVPFGTALINEAISGGTSSRTLSVDEEVTFLGEPTTKCVIVGSGSSANIELGTAGDTIDLDVDAQDILDRRILFAVKTDGANTVIGGVLYLGTADYSGFRTFNYQTEAVDWNATASDGWMIFERPLIGASGTSGDAGAMDIPKRAKLRLTMAGNVAAGTIWVAPVRVAPRPVPAVVLTFDDGYADQAWLAGQASDRNLPISIGISKDLIDSVNMLTSAQLASLAANPLVDLINHSTDNSSYGELGLSGYVSEVEECRVYLAGAGAGDGALIHPYIQGSTDADLQNELIDLGYKSARLAGDDLRGAANALIGLGGEKALMTVPLAVTLRVDTTLTEAKAQLESAVRYGTAFVMGHKFRATADGEAWVDDYDADHGILDLLDWLAEKRTTEGWRILRYSEWVDLMHTGVGRQAEGDALLMESGDALLLESGDKILLED